MIFSWLMTMHTARVCTIVSAVTVRYPVFETSTKLRLAFRVLSHDERMWHTTHDIYKHTQLAKRGDCQLKQTTGWPKKVSHNQESSLNRIKNRHQG